MPLALVEKILKVSSKKEYLVYDCFMGSGTTAVGCLKNNIDYIGSELNNTHYKNSLQRISKYNQQKKLF